MPFPKTDDQWRPGDAPPPELGVLDLSQPVMRIPRWRKVLMRVRGWIGR